MSGSGFGALGEYALGMLPKAKFEIPSEEDSGSITVVSELVGRKLIEYYRENPDEIRIIGRRKFEEFVAEIFLGFGYDVELTGKTKDGGVDIIAVKSIDDVGHKYLIECKRPDPGNPVGVGVVRELYGVKCDNKATKAILVTTTYFSRDARQFQERNNWELDLKDYNDLLVWIIKYLNS